MRHHLLAALAVAAFAGAFLVPQAATADDLEVCTGWSMGGPGPSPDFPKVVAACSTVIQSADASAVVQGYRNRARAYCGLGQFALAAQDFQQVKDLDKESDEVEDDARDVRDAQMALSDPTGTDCQRWKDGYDAAGGAH